VHTLLRVGGIVYITTPNSMTPWKMLHAAKRLLTLRGIGLTAPEIFHTVTYGHHWKEYSAAEVRDYFHRLSQDFDVNIAHFNYPTPQVAHDRGSLKAKTRQAVHSVAALVPPFRDQLEIVVRLRERTAFRLAPPSYV